MAKTSQNDTFYANNKRTLRFTISDEDQTPAVALDVTNLTVRWALAKVMSDGTYSTTAVLKKDTAGVGGITKTDAVNGIVDVLIHPGDTSALYGSYYQELEIVDGAGDPVVVATGTLTILKNVKNT